MSAQNRLTTAQKIDFIKKSEDFNHMQLEWFPPTASDEYYFVSYSHKDYQAVFKDLFELIEYGGKEPFAVWYDKDLCAGKDWEIEAENHIYDYKCKGVIFYISENSVDSDAIHKEINFVRKTGKPYLTINLPIKNDENINYLSASEILKYLKEQNRLTNPNNYIEKLKILEETFNAKVIFLQDNHDAKLRVNKIRSSLKSPPLFELAQRRNVALYDYDNSLIKNSVWLQHLTTDLSEQVVDFCLPHPVQIIAVNDTNLKIITEEDYQKFHVKEIADDLWVEWHEKNNVEKKFQITSIGQCAFANCRRLEKIYMPTSIKYIYDRAFYNCNSLLSIDLSNIAYIDINAFAFCDKLSEIKFNKKGDLCFIGESAFHNCVSLAQELFLPDELEVIGENAFCGSGIKKVIFSKDSELKSLGNGAFRYCLNLEEAVFPDIIAWTISKYNEFKIGKFAFGNCTRLKKVKLPIGTISIDEEAFCCCDSIEEIEIPEGVQFIGANAFGGCDNLLRLVIPNSVKSIGECALASCEKLASLNYKGTKRQWKKVKKDSSWDKDTGNYVIYCLNGEIEKQ